MVGVVHLVRHAEAAHNVDKNFDLRDPALTSLGREQGEELGKSFPYLGRTSLILSSPLRRAIETAEALSRAGVTDSSSQTVKIVLDPDAQEVSSLPCDTGSSAAALRALFPDSKIDFDILKDGWEVKEGLYSSDSEVVEQRASRLRKRLAELVKEGGDVVVVTHGGFMKVLSGDPVIDLPKAGWRSYGVVEDGEGNVKLVESHEV